LVGVGDVGEIWECGDTVMMFVCGRKKRSDGHIHDDGDPRPE
jgi:hypothetical protein